MNPDPIPGQNDTIVAVSTPPGEGGIGIVRLSGPGALGMALAHCKLQTKKATGSRGKDHFVPAPRRLYLAYFLDHEGEAIDEILFSYMPAPHSYTCEDVVEVNAHGGALSVGKILGTLLRSGARLAEPGEFTRRAYLNGRIDLVQAESSLALIRAKTEKGMKAALQGVQGSLSAVIRDLRSQLMEAAAEIEVNVDFPHEDLQWELEHRDEIEGKIRRLKAEVDYLLEKHKTGRILQEGLKTVITGKPNVGKSSLYNALLGENRALVTNIPGTTRDLLIDFINVQGVPLKIIDSAGIRVDGDALERLGMDYSRRALQEADLVILLLDASTGLTDEDCYVYKAVEEVEAARIILVNKMDLNPHFSRAEVSGTFQADAILFVSLAENRGLQELQEAVVDLTFSGEMQGEEGALVLEARQGELLRRAAGCLQEALRSFGEQMPLDLTTIDIKQAHDSLGEVIGEQVPADLLDMIFERFCIGK